MVRMCFFNLKGGVLSVELFLRWGFVGLCFRKVYILFGFLLSFSFGVGFGID